MTEMNGQEMVVRPSGGGALASVEQQRAIAEVQGAMMIARANPRNTMKATEAIVQDCTRPGLAAAATFDYIRGGSAIEGATIRLAEAMAQRWGNLTFGIRELERNQGSSIIEAYAWDLETNTRRETTFTVPHIRDKKGGVKVRLESSRDIYEITANMGARRLRACILGVIPGDVQESALEQVAKTLKTKVDLTPDRIAKMLETFKDHGVSREQIEARIQRRIDAMTPALFIQLGKIANSLKDEMSTPGDWFEMPEKAPASTDKGTAGVKKAMRAKATEELLPKMVQGRKPGRPKGSKNKPKSEGEQEPPEETASEPEGEGLPNDTLEGKQDSSPVAESRNVLLNEIDTLIGERNLIAWKNILVDERLANGKELESLPEERLVQILARLQRAAPREEEE